MGALLSQNRALLHAFISCVPLIKEQAIMILIKALLAQFAFLHSASAFVVPIAPLTSNAQANGQQLCMASLDEGCDRRSILNIASAAVAASVFAPIIANADGKSKVVVMGGAGY